MKASSSQVSALDFDREHCLQALFKNTNNVIICLNLDLQITEFNPAAECAYAWKRKQVIGKNLLKLCAKYSLKSPICAKPIKNLQKRRACKTTLQGKYTLLWHVTELLDHDGAPVGYMLVGQQEATETAIKANSNKSKQNTDSTYFNYVLDRIPGSVYWKDRQGALLGCNNYMAKLAGCNHPSEVIGKRDDQFPWRESADDLRKIDQQVMESGQEITTEEVGKLIDGEVHTFLTTKTPLKNEQDEIVGILGVSMDITTRKQLERELKLAKEAAELSKRATEIYLEMIMASLPCHVYWKNKEGVYLGCNDRQAQSVGLTCGADVIGKTDFDLCWKEHAPLFRANDEEVMQTGRSIIVEEPLTLANGTTLTVISNKAPLHDAENNIIGVVGVSVDISERKASEQALIEAKEIAEAANQAKSRFLSSMAHDLRTPTNGILGMAELIHDKVAAIPDLDFYFESISKSGKTLVRLVDDILNFAKLESGKFELVSEPFNFREIIQEVMAMVTPQANQKGIQLLIDYSDQVPRYLISDPHCLRRILINLVSNALKFTNSGYVWVSVTTVSINGKAVTLQLQVEDTGIGIPKNKLGLIFERFGRVEGSHESKYQGTGLGLTIVKEIVEKIDGKITVDSVYGEGTTFTCILPFYLQDITARCSVWQRRYGKTKVMVVDANKRRGNVILNTLGINDEVTTAAQALEKLLQAHAEGVPYQIILIDDEASTNPLALVAAIKKQEELNVLPILFSKPVTLAQSDAAKAAGYFALLIKPVHPTELINDLTRHWQNWLNKHTDLKTLIKNLQPAVLLIEDDMISRHFVKVVLTDLGCKVEAVENGKQALAVLHDDFDVIFSDLGLPDMTGIELAKTIRKTEACDNFTPIVALTGHLEGDYKDQCLRAGMNDFVEKPINKEKLIQILARWTLGEGAQSDNAATIGRWAERELG